MLEVFYRLRQFAARREAGASEAKAEAAFVGAEPAFEVSFPMWLESCRAGAFAAYLHPSAPAGPRRHRAPSQHRKWLRLISSTKAQPRSAAPAQTAISMGPSAAKRNRRLKAGT